MARIVAVAFLAFLGASCAPAGQDYAAGWRDSRARSAAYLRGLATTIRAERPDMAQTAATLDAAAYHVERIEKD